MSESWRKTFREGIAPHLTTEGLEALRTALETDDVRLIQGATTTPPPLLVTRDWNCVGACPIAFPGWQGDGLKTVEEVEEYFARVCFECDQLLGEPATCRWFLNWVDETPRPEMRRELLKEVIPILAKREQSEADYFYTKTSK